MPNTVKYSALLLPLLLAIAGCADDGADRGPSYGYGGAGSYGDYYDGRDYWYYDRDGKRHRRGDRDGHHHDGKGHDGKGDRDGKWDRDGDRDRDGNREERRADSDGEDRRGDSQGRTREEEERNGRDGLTLRQQENQRSGGSAVGGYNAPTVERIAPAGDGRGRER